MRPVLAKVFWGRLLGQIGDRHAVEPLIAVLQDGDADPDVAWAAAYALGQLGDARALPALEQATEGDSRKTRYGWPVAGTARRAVEWVRVVQWWERECQGS